MNATETPFDLRRDESLQLQHVGAESQECDKGGQAGKQIPTVGAFVLGKSNSMRQTRLADDKNLVEIQVVPHPLVHSHERYQICGCSIA